MRSVLVTGGAGFIGGNFTHRLARTAPDVRLVVLDALTYSGNRATLDPLVEAGAVTFVHGDVTDAALLDHVLARHHIDTVVHFAAESHVDRSISSAAAFVRTNVQGTQVLLDACRRAWSGPGGWAPGVRFHHVSSDEVFGALGPGDPPFTEASPYAPNSPYAASKAGADHLVRAWAHTYGLPVSVSNSSNNYGPYQFPEKLVPLFIVHALRGDPLPVYGDGLQARDWLYVEDHCAAIEAILRAPVAGSVFLVGGRAERTNLEIAEALCALVDARFAADGSLAERFPRCPAAAGERCASLVTHVGDRPGHDRRYAIDPTALESALGVRPRETLETGLARTVDWYLAHEAWWRGVLDGSYRRPPT